MGHICNKLLSGLLLYLHTLQHGIKGIYDMYRLHIVRDQRSLFLRPFLYILNLLCYLLEGLRQ